MCAVLSLFFFNDTATTEIYTLSLHDALPIYHIAKSIQLPEVIAGIADDLMKSIDAEFPSNVGASSEPVRREHAGKSVRSEEHTSELQSPDHLVCRLLLEKKKCKHTTRKTRDI